MNRKRGVNSNGNRLLYDPNQRKQKRLGAFSMDENLEEETAEQKNVQNENLQQETQQNDSSSDNLSNETNSDSASSLGNVSNKNNSQRTSNKIQNAGDMIKNAAKKIAKKILMFILSNPWLLLILGIIIFIILIIVIIAGGVDSGDENTGGYYNVQCDFNNSTVNLTYCDTDDVVNLTLEEYVLGTTYALIEDHEILSEESLKALMIIVKTNALSYGGYNNTTKYLTLDDCSTPFKEIQADDDSIYQDLVEIYDSIDNYLYLSSSFNSAITSLSAANALPLNDDVLEQINGSDYEGILDKIYNANNNSNNIETSGTLYVGDSRTHGMMLTGVISSENTIYGTGYGYNWFIGNGTFTSSNTNATNGAVAAVNAKISSGESYNIVIWLGVNDYSYISAEQYYNEYYELATNEWQNQNIYIVEVGPVDDNLATNVDNAGIESFNNELRELIYNSDATNLNYIDINYSIQNYDGMGVHYGNEDYVSIYESLQNQIALGQGDYDLYDLAAYCEYYTVTENDAYWWPIGSSEATEGNVYGGTPAFTSISSYFGPRVIEGQNGNHGAIDIPATCNVGVVVATKGGTVIKTSNTCDNNGYYENPCGGTFGNYVYIEHEDGVVTKYAHLYPDSITVSEGDTVVQGQKIAMVGNSGSSTGCHLHFQFEVNGTKVDPLEYVDPENPRPINLSLENMSLDYIGNDLDSKNAICETLLASGFSTNAVVGIMINLQAESGFSPINLQNSYEESLGYDDSSYTLAIDYGVYPRNSFIYDSAGYGLIQWTYYSRKAGLYDYAKGNGYSIGSLQMQLEYMLMEVQNYDIVSKYLTGNYSAYEISNAWCDYFESPAGSESCKYNNICPSNYCSNRTLNSIDAITSYVENGCQ